MVTDRSLANLEPQKAGDPSKNPNGRPKGASIKAIIRRWLEMEAGELTLPDGTKLHITKQDAAIRKQLSKAIDEGDTSALKLLLEYAHDKPVQRSENQNMEVKEFTDRKQELQDEQDELFRLQEAAKGVAPKE
jgi:hypothetical protein